MPERAAVLEQSQLGVEVTPGTAVAATKRLLCTHFQMSPNVPIKEFRPHGSKFTTTNIRGKEETQGTIDGVLSYNDIVYLACGLLKNVAPTVPGGATNTRRWTFAPSVFSPNAPVTYTLQQGNAYYAEQAAFGMIDGLTIRVTKDEASVQGTLIAQQLQESIAISSCDTQTVNLGGATGGTFTLTDGGSTTGALAFNITAAALQTALQGLSNMLPGGVLVTLVSPGVYSVAFVGPYAQAPQTLMTIGATSLTGATGPAVTRTQVAAAPTSIVEFPVDADNIQIQVGSTIGGLTKLTRVLECEIQIANAWSGLHTIDDGTNSFSNSVEKAPTYDIKLTVEHNSDAAGFMADLRAKNEKWFRMLCTGPQIESGFNNRIQWTCPFKFKGAKRGETEDVADSAFDLIPINDSVNWGSGALELVVDNQLTSL